MQFTNDGRATVSLRGAGGDAWSSEFRFSIRASDYLWRVRHTLADLPNVHWRLFGEAFVIPLDAALTASIDPTQAERPEEYAAALRTTARKLRTTAEKFRKRLAPCDTTMLPCRVYDTVGNPFGLLFGAGTPDGPSITYRLSYGAWLGYDEMDIARRSQLLQFVAPDLGAYLSSFDYLVGAKTLLATLRSNLMRKLVVNIEELRSRVRTPHMARR